MREPIAEIKELDNDMEHLLQAPALSREYIIKWECSPAAFREDQASSMSTAEDTAAGEEKIVSQQERQQRLQHFMLWAKNTSLT